MFITLLFDRDEYFVKSEALTMPFELMVNEAVIWFAHSPLETVAVGIE